MHKIVIVSKLTPEQFFSKARAFFGDQGLNLSQIDESDCCINFEGGGGFVNMTAAIIEGKSQVIITSREWENQVRKFIKKIL
jgi:hypothetical protein